MKYRLQTERRTIGKVLRPRLLQSQIVDSPVGWIVLRLPVELLEEVGTNNRQFACIQRESAAHGARERKSEGEGRIKGEIVQSAHDEGSCMGIITWCVVRRE